MVETLIVVKAEPDTMIPIEISKEWFTQKLRYAETKRTVAIMEAWPMHEQEYWKGYLSAYIEFLQHMQSPTPRA